MSDIFSYIRENVDILDLVSQYVNLRPNGSYWKGLSPFKSEKTPSFTVSPAKKIFYCFSTNTGGDVIDFISKVERCTQFEAAQILINKYRLVVPKNLNYLKKENKEEDNLYYSICDFFAKWAHSKILKNERIYREAFDYFINRNISVKTLQRFLIGYCPSSIYIDDFLNLAKKDGILISDILKSGIILENNKLKNKYIFTFEERIIFPILNTLGIVCGFGGRVFKQNDSRAKYINTSAHKEFSKKNILYGLSNSKKSISINKSAIIVEGYFDYLACFESGFENVVATMGTAFTENHLYFLDKIVDSVILMYDSDKAGQNAILKVIMMCWNSSLDVYIVKMPMGDDPASLYSKGTLADYVKNKISAVDFFIDYQMTDYDNSSMKEKEGKLNLLIECIYNIKDKFKKEIIISDVSRKLRVSQYFLKDKVENFLKNKIDKKEKSNEIEIIKKPEIVNEIKNIDKNEIEEWYVLSICYILFYNYNNIESDFKKNTRLIILGFAPKICISLISKFEEFNSMKDKEIKSESDYLLFFDRLEGELKDVFLIRIAKYNFEISNFKIIYSKIFKKIWIKYLKKDYLNDSLSIFDKINVKSVDEFLLALEKKLILNKQG